MLKEEIIKILKGQTNTYALLGLGVEEFTEEVADSILALIQETLKECLPEEVETIGEDPEDYGETYDNGFNTSLKMIITNLKAKNLWKEK